MKLKGGHIFFFVIAAITYIVGFAIIVSYPTISVWCFIGGLFITILTVVSAAKYTNEMNESVPSTSAPSEESLWSDIEWKKKHLPEFSAWLSNFEAELEKIGTTFDDVNDRILDFVFAKNEFKLGRINNSIVICYRWDLLRLLHSYVKGKLSNNSGLGARFIENKEYKRTIITPVDTLLYWKVEGEVETHHYTKAPSAASIAATEAIFGTAAATRKALSTTAYSPSLTFDKRIIIACFSYESGIGQISADYETEHKKMLSLFPEKAK